MTQFCESLYLSLFPLCPSHTLRTRYVLSIISAYASFSHTSHLIAIKASSSLSFQVHCDTVALCSGAIYRCAVPSFHLLSLPMVAPTDGTAPSGSHAKDKQPAHTPQSNAPNPGATPTPPFPMPSSTEQRIASLEAQLSSLLTMIQQVQQAILQATLQQQMQPQQHQPFPPQELPPQHLPPPLTLQSNTFVLPISLNPASGMSLDCSFPHVNPALWLAIAKHKFCPGHLYKLDAIVKEKPTAKTFEISDNGMFMQHERDASSKDYPSFHMLFDPLVIYFEILQFFIISSGNVAAIHQVNLGCSEYLCILYQIYSRYEWSAVLQYHFMFHNHHLAEMHDGDYSGWQIMDSELASLYLYGNPKAKSTSYSNTSSSSNAKQICFAFQSAKCASPCTHGRIHKCKICSSPYHGRSACTDKSKPAT